MTAFGAVLGLIIAIVLIMRKANPAYSLILGAISSFTFCGNL